MGKRLGVMGTTETAVGQELQWVSRDSGEVTNVIPAEAGIQFFQPISALWQTRDIDAGKVETLQERWDNINEEQNESL